MAGRTASAAGSCWTCWGSQECSAPSPSRVLCGRLCLTYSVLHMKKNEKEKAWKEVARHPPHFAWPACPAGAAQEERLLLLRKATTAGLVLEHMYVLVCICVHLVSERAPTRRLPPTSPSLAGWPGGCGERGTCAAVSITPLGSCSGGGLAGRTAAASAAGSCLTCWGSQECSAPSPSRVGKLI